MDASSDFWDILDTNEVTKEEFVLATSYLVDTWRKQGLKVVADKFVKEAKFVEVKELDGSHLVYKDAFDKGGSGMDYFTFFCHEKLKLERLKGTQTNPQSLTTDQICVPKIDTLCKLSKYIVAYTFANFNIIDMLSDLEPLYKQRVPNNHEFPTFAPSGSNSESGNLSIFKTWKPTESGNFKLF